MCQDVTCPALDACHLDGTCDSQTGDCIDKSKPAGTSCDDNNVCNGTASCDANGTCVAGPAPAIDDKNPCTVDACDPQKGVTHVPVASGTSCSNGNACDGVETCNSSGACVAGPAPNLDDGNPCTSDRCDPTTGVTHKPLPAGSSCADADVCNGLETCDGQGNCQKGSVPVIDDGNPCTADSCDSIKGILHVPVAANTSCADANRRLQMPSFRRSNRFSVKNQVAPSGPVQPPFAS